MRLDARRVDPLGDVARGVERLDDPVGPALADENAQLVGARETTAHGRDPQVGAQLREVIGERLDLRPADVVVRVQELPVEVGLLDDVVIEDDKASDAMRCEDPRDVGADRTRPENEDGGAGERHELGLVARQGQ